MSTHILKSEFLPYMDVITGVKHAEVRVNDRNFKVGDMLELRQCIDGHFTGCFITRRITHIQAGYGLPEKLVVLSIVK